MPVDTFNEFWAFYPRRVNKGSARTAFLKLEKKGILPDLQILIDAIKAQAEVYKKRPAFYFEGWQYFPHASTWLNNERWEDEVEKKKDKTHATPEAGKYDDI